MHAFDFVRSQFRPNRISIHFLFSSHLPHSHITFNCKQCPKSFASLRTYFEHNHAITDSELNMLKPLLPPPLCVIEGEEMEHLVHEEKEQRTKFKCSICDIILSSELSRKQHEKRHSNLIKYQCRLCKR